MANGEQFVLKNAEKESRDQFQAALDKLKWGIVVLLGPESPELQDIFDMINDNISPKIQVFAVWAQDKAAVQDAIMGLTGGSSVNFGPNGHRIVSININDTVSLTLSAFEATDSLEVIGAILCACTR